MSGVYLTQMGEWFREAGLTVIEYQGWQTRARGSGGYADSSRPWCVMWHHTASGKSMDGQGDAAYCAVGDSDAPLSNVYIERSGAVWLLAAGATNTNGKGYARSFSKGTVPDNSMNSYAFGVEMGNDGSGEPWPSAQIDAMFLVSNTVNQKLGNKPDDVCTHQQWAPDRKVDPATASAVQGTWKPRSCTSSGTWDLADIKAECLARAGARPLPPQPVEPIEPITYYLGAIHDEGDAMFIGQKDGKYWIGNGIGRREVPKDQLDAIIAMFERTDTPLIGFSNGRAVVSADKVPSGKQMQLLGINIAP